MNILFIERACDGTIGGSHTCLYNLVNNLDRSKYNIWVVFYQNNAYVNKLRNIGVNVILLSRNALVYGNILIRKMRNWYRLVYKLRKELKYLLNENRIDLVVINNTIYDSKDILDVCNKLQIPVIVYERGYTNYHPSDIQLSKRIYASIAVSYAIKSNMEKQKYYADIRVIYDGISVNGHNNNFETKSCADIKVSIGIPIDSIIIGIIGNIREWKGQEYFVKAFLSLGEKFCNMYGLVIGGYGPEDVEYVDYVKNIAKESEVGRRLIFLGFRDDVPDLLKIMDVFVHTSIMPEPFGMVLLEAMSHRVPVIATNFGGPIETLENGNCGILVPPRNAKAIMDGVEKYLNDPLFRKEIVNRAYKRVENEFDLLRTVKSVDDLFQEIIGRSTRQKHIPPYGTFRLP